MASGQKLFEINEIWVTNKGQRMALTFSTCISPCTQFKCAIYTNFYTIYLILTHLACIANAKKNVFYSATIHWAEMRDAILRRFMTSSFPSTMSL